MPMKIELPQVGESVHEGIIGKWLKKVGEKVEKYDPLVEVVTDKVTMEVPSPVGGVLVSILAEEGKTVPMGAPIAEIEAEAGAAATTAPSAVTPLTPPAVGAKERPSEVVALQVAEEKRHYSPAVRRLAEEQGVDLAKVSGTGLGGRVTREDVLKYIEQRQQAPPAPPSAPAPVAAPVAGMGSDEEVVQLTPLRRIIADNMIKSASQIPHAWSITEVDVTALVARRQTAKEEFLRREGVTLTYLPFFIKAAVEALKAHPIVNASWGGDKIILKKRVNVGVAVATPAGLIVPVIHDADRVSIAGLARATRDLAERAETNKLTIADVQGGTFTINNTGVLGSTVSVPLINYPQAAILATEAIVRRPVILGDAIAIRHMMNICIAFDHRVMDGQQAGEFLQAVKRNLEAMGPETHIY